MIHLVNKLKASELDHAARFQRDFFGHEGFDVIGLTKSWPSFADGQRIF